MDFRLELNPRPQGTRILHQDKILLMGSCFTEQVSSRLAAYKFQVMENPHGILFNPLSITRALISYLEEKEYKERDLFYANERWSSWDHHSRFSNLEKAEALRQINESRRNATAFLEDADWLLLTLGSAFVYELESGMPVANCHKMPSQQFRKKLLTVEETISAIDNVMHRLFMKNPKLKIIFTISPVRHLRDGFVENNWSKAILIQATHHLVEKFDRLFYFPAYELVIDDLRDYRFYAEDMVHPNYLATDYVWKKFQETCLDPALQPLMRELEKINLAMRHKPFHPETGQHQQFLKATLERLAAIKENYPYLNLEEEKAWFSAQIVNAGE